MTTTTIEQEMLHYFTRLNEKEQQSLLNLIKTFISSRKDFEPQTLEEYNNELEQADTEIEAGDYVTHEEVKKMFLK
jgi:hypothetical protein